jgi:hypothetical protein
VRGGIARRPTKFYDLRVELETVRLAHREAREEFAKALEQEHGSPQQSDEPTSTEEQIRDMIMLLTARRIQRARQAWVMIGKEQVPLSTWRRKHKNLVRIQPWLYDKLREGLPQEPTQNPTFLDACIAGPYLAGPTFCILQRDDKDDLSEDESSDMPVLNAKRETELDMPRICHWESGSMICRHHKTAVDNVWHYLLWQQGYPIGKIGITVRSVSRPISTWDFLPSWC